jgi:hypothetical protein
MTLVYEGQSSEDDFPITPTSKLKDVVKFLSDKLNEIPEDHRDDAFCSLESYAYYDSSYTTLQIGFYHR